MTKLFSLSLIFLFAFQVSFGQFGSQHVLDSNANGITEIHLSDLNQDNFKDIIISQKFSNNNQIAYYQNIGNGTFGNQQILASDVLWPPTVTSGDVDGDSWNDLVTLSRDEGTLKWYQNSLGVFASPVNIDTSIFIPMDVKLGDIDNDSDLDIVCVGDIELSVYYNDGEGNFTKNSIPHGIITEYYDLVLTDLDNDGFLDVIVGGIRTLIYKNTNGIIAFDTARTNSIDEFSLVLLVDAADLNNDGFTDIIINGQSQSDLRWYKNDGNGFFSLEQIFETNAVQCRSVALKDFDNDGDVDVFTAYSQTGQVVWYSNNGNGVFSALNLIHQGDVPYTNKVAADDLNNDGKVDIVWSQELSYHLNNTVLSVNDNTHSTLVNVYPNPVSEQLHIDLDRRYEDINIRITNSLGQMISSHTFYSKQNIDIILDGSKGLYFVEITLDNKETKVLKLLKN